MSALLLASGCGIETADPTRGTPSPEQRIYSYKNNQGRTVYVNDLARVPRAARKQAAAVDLSQISLNPGLAADLEQQAVNAHRRLAKTRFCDDVRGTARLPWWRRIWREHGHLVLIAAVALGLVAATPWAIRRLDAPRWARLLIWLVPLLAALAAISHAAAESSRSVRRLRRDAALCQPPASGPTDVAGRLQVVDELRRRIEHSAAARKRQLERLDAPELL